ncbi:MAG: hypothetical protein IPN85_12670 [Flavobacteriales bacterium]|jgi:hypothetical protein|nr:hypothetical protein [Flavobacteriales bacterium]MBK9289857.1 hypothetical protein [Flavobacteriales bacterium]MBL0036596.1 hypothetical protein [Flavobacteriales bacterium]
MKRFLLRILIFAIPVLVLLGSYFVTDPFKVLRSYADPSKDHVVTLNKDHIGTTTYLNLKDEVHYNAFLFGSSRTLAFRLKDWKAHLPADAVPFAFDANKESLFGILGKIRLIDASGGPLDHAIVVICPLHTFAPFRNSESALYIKDPRVSGESAYAFQKTMLAAYFSDLFFVKYLDHALTGRRKPYMDDVLTFSNRNQYDPVSLERLMAVEATIQADPERYYREHKDLFPARDTTRHDSYPAMIGPEHLTALREIKTIFNKQGTDYAIVISPLYDQKAIATRDLAILRGLFGTGHVFDHSGNNALTSDMHNYLENSHYRASVGRRIMDEIHR